ncbi:MAG: DUF177 domain-containing protein [Desulfobacterales bacterium]|nr:DUF177 domain-containing protein [Desulfobacterales bacterium]
MKIRFGEIPKTGLQYEINDHSWFPGPELDRTAPVRAHVFVRRKGNERVFLEGEIKAFLALDCDRCMASYSVPLAGAFTVDLELFPDPGGLPEEHQCGKTEMDTIFLEEPVFDLLDVLAEQVLLLVPAKRVCGKGCRGLCAQCGANLNQGPCTCGQDQGASPFNVLGKLKK